MTAVTMMKMMSMMMMRRMLVIVIVGLIAKLIRIKGACQRAHYPFFRYYLILSALGSF